MRAGDESGIGANVANARYAIMVAVSLIIFLRVLRLPPLAWRMTPRQVVRYLVAPFWGAVNGHVDYNHASRNEEGGSG